MALKKYECVTCKGHPIKKENNFVSIDSDQIGVKIQGIKNIVDCQNVRFSKNQVTCRTCEALLYQD